MTSELIRRLEEEGPNHALDEAIFEAVRGRKRQISTFEQYEPSERLPNYTSSIDAALTLVPEGMSYKIIGAGVMKAQAAVFDGTREGWHATAIDAHPATALCIAALKARAVIPNSETNAGLSTVSAHKGATQR